MAVAIPFPLPSTGYALNSQMRVNFDFVVSKFNEFNTGTATWDNVTIGTQNTLTGALAFYNASNSYYFKIQPSLTAAGNITLTLPSALPASTSLVSITAAGVMTFTDSPTVTSIQAGTVVLPNGSNFDTNLKCHPSTATDYDFYFPSTNGDSNQFLKSDGTYCVWGDSPVVAGTASYLSFYDGAVIGAASTSVRDYFSFNSHSVRVGIADHGALAADRTYTIPNAGANATFQMQGGAGSFSSVESDDYLIGYRLRLRGAASGNFILRAASVTTDYDLHMPAAQGGANTYLKNDGSGNLSWVTLPAVGATTALDNLASVAINTSLVSDTDNTDDLGSSTKAWKDIFFAGSLKNGATTLATAAEVGYLSGVSSAIQTQLNAKVATTGDETVAGIKSFSSTVRTSDSGIQFSADTNTGINRAGGDLLVLAAGGNRVYCSDSALFPVTTNVTDLGADGFVWNRLYVKSIKGTATNDDAAAGYIGEYVVSNDTTAGNMAGNGVWTDVTSISLTAGDWDVSGVVFSSANSSNTSSNGGAISLYSGATTTDHVAGLNVNLVTYAGNAANDAGVALPTYRVSLASTTTVYLKARQDYTSGTPQCHGTIRARRVR